MPEWSAGGVGMDAEPDVGERSAVWPGPLQRSGDFGRVHAERGTAELRAAIWIRYRVNVQCTARLRISGAHHHRIYGIWAVQNR